MKLCLFLLFSIAFLFRGSTSEAQIITTVAGNGITSSPLGDGGIAVSANITLPGCGSFDGNGNYYFEQAFGAARFRKVNLCGIINTVAGTGVSGYSGDGGLAI